MNTNDLTTFGWDEFFESAFQPYAANGYDCGRVALEHKHLYRVYSEWGEGLGEIAGRLRHEALDRGDLPVVGDWVVVGIHNPNVDFLKLEVSDGSIKHAAFLWPARKKFRRVSSVGSQFRRRSWELFPAAFSFCRRCSRYTGSANLATLFWPNNND
jgi:hypothetical protein